MAVSNLTRIAQQIVAAPKGILAIDESPGTIEKRFGEVAERLHIEFPCTPETRLAYRLMLITAPELNAYISGAILHAETLHQEDGNGNTFPEILMSKGILTVIKIDEGLEGKDQDGQKLTNEVPNLDKKLSEYASQGAVATKWRAVYRTGATAKFIAENTRRQAVAAKKSQIYDLVPIVEPEVLMDGSHSMEECYAVTARVLRALFQQLKTTKVDLEAMVLKPNMILPGKDQTGSTFRATPVLVAERTVTCFLGYVPKVIAGIAFLSGGQSDDDAVRNLSAIASYARNYDAGRNAPWRLTFSYGRGLQREALEIWAQTQNLSSAQNALLKQARAVSQASAGRYT